MNAGAFVGFFEAFIDADYPGEDDNLDGGDDEDEEGAGPEIERF